METKTTRKFDDIVRVREIQLTQLEMLMAMHSGLSEITKNDDPIAMSAIAEQTLEKVRIIAFSLNATGEKDAEITH